MNRYLPIVMFLAVLFNFGTVLFFKFKVARDLNTKLADLAGASDRRFEAFASDVLSRVDAFLYSNVVNRASFPASGSSSASSAALTPSEERRLILHEVVSSDFDYDYFSDGKPHAYLQGVVYSVGDPFPRGGVISSICPDSILVSDRYVFLRSSRSSYSVMPDLISKKGQND